MTPFRLLMLHEYNTGMPGRRLSALVSMHLNRANGSLCCVKVTREARRTTVCHVIISGMKYIIRDIRPSEYHLLEEFLYQAIWVPDDFDGEIPRSIVRDDPKCRAAFEGFGSLPDDHALVAEIDGRVIGACWVRTTDEYGHVDNETPSFSISLFEEYRGYGIGTALMRNMVELLAATGYKRASLSVQKENPALRLYERVGFRIIGDGTDDSERLMIRDLDDLSSSAATNETQR